MSLDDDIIAILGYACETQAPNSQPTTEYITDRWMKPRRDALVRYVERRMEHAWDKGVEATAEWMANNPTPAGVPIDPPRNPYRPI